MLARARCFVVLFAVAMLISVSMAKAELKVGDAAPDLVLPDQHGNTIRLSDFRGKQSVVLAFYVRAGTPG